MNGTRGNMAVVVKKVGRYRYKAHRILMPNGSEFVLNTKIETEGTTGWMTVQKDGESLPISSVSDTIVTKNNTSVNTDYMQNSQKDASKKIDSRKDVDDSVQSQEFEIWFGDWREKDMTPIKIAQNKGTMHGKIQNIDTGWTINIPGKANNETKT
ncbi:MAG: hypothetical protein SPI97_08470, partial [Oscillospiraceae bacterium]|nr:hypothetical protein [Oscillospiraceae bacterium]